MKRTILPVVLLFATAVWYFAYPSKNLSDGRGDAGNATAIADMATPVQQPAQATKPTAKDPVSTKASVSMDGVEMLKIPSEYVLGDTREVEAADSTEALFDRFSDADRELLQAFNDKYADIFGFDFKQQYEWMVRNGYPTPEDVLFAQTMTDEELAQVSGAVQVAGSMITGADLESYHEKLANPGNIKALWLYLDRMMDNAEKALGDSGLSRRDFVTSPGYLDQERHWVFNATLMDRKASPLAGYAMFRFNRDFRLLPFSALASLMRAGRTDLRALYYTSEFVDREPRLNDDVLSGMVTMMAADSISEYGRGCLPPVLDPFPIVPPDS